MACGTEMPKVVSLPNAVLYGGRYGANLCGHSTTHRIHNSIAFSAQLVRYLVNLYRSPSLRIGVPIVSPVAPCTPAFGKAWQRSQHNQVFSVPRDCFHCSPVFLPLWLFLSRRQAKLYNPFAKVKVSFLSLR